MYCLYSINLNPLVTRGLTRGLIHNSCHQGAQVGTSGVVCDVCVLRLTSKYFSSFALPTQVDEAIDHLKPDLDLGGPGTCPFYNKLLRCVHFYNMEFVPLFIIFSKHARTNLWNHLSSVLSVLLACLVCLVDPPPPLFSSRCKRNGGVAIQALALSPLIHFHDLACFAVLIGLANAAHKNETQEKGLAAILARRCR